MAFGWSAAIEITQLLTHRGLFEFDDIIHNTFGAFLGLFLFSLIRNIGGKRKEQKE